MKTTTIDEMYMKELASYPPDYFLPVEQAIGMSDCAEDWGRPFNDVLYRLALLANTIPVGDGQRWYRQDKSFSEYIYDLDDECEYDDDRFRLRLYPIFLCSDGRIRYRKDEQVEKIIDASDRRLRATYSLCAREYTNKMERNDADE